MPLIVTVNTTAECLRTDCNVLGGGKPKKFYENINQNIQHPERVMNPDPQQQHSPPDVFNFVIHDLIVLINS